MSLLLSNILQAFGAVMNFKWLGNGQAVVGQYCMAQGVLIQSGNLGTAMWCVFFYLSTSERTTNMAPTRSFVISIHLFNELFLHLQSNKAMFLGALGAVWSFVLVTVLVGRFVIQNAEQGPYFGISGAWCWISSAYPNNVIIFGYLFVSLSNIPQ